MRWILVVCAVVPLLAILPAAHAGPVGATVWGDARGDVAAVSVFGDSYGENAASATGNATFAGCSTAMCGGTSVSGTRHAQSEDVAVSGTGNASRSGKYVMKFWFLWWTDSGLSGAAASGTGAATCDKSHSDFFGDYDNYYYFCVAASGTGRAACSVGANCAALSLCYDEPDPLCWNPCGDDAQGAFGSYVEEDVELRPCGSPQIGGVPSAAASCTSSSPPTVQFCWNDDAHASLVAVSLCGRASGAWVNAEFGSLRGITC